MHRGYLSLKGSRLQDYLTILQTIFSSHQPLNLLEIKNAAKLVDVDIEKALSLLIKQDVIKRQHKDVSQTFFVAPLGIKLIQYFASNATLKNV